MKNQTGTAADFFDAFIRSLGTAMLATLCAGMLYCIRFCVHSCIATAGRLLQNEPLPDPVPPEIQDQTRTPSREGSRRNSTEDPEAVPLIPMMQMQMMNSTATQARELPTGPNRRLRS